jgi:predicted flavoprotein YhiN
VLGLPTHLDDKAMSDLDAIIVGAGHNGLTCAAYLGMAGLRVRVFLAPSLSYMEQAYRDCVRSGWSRMPIIEMVNSVDT